MHGFHKPVFAALLPVALCALVGPKFVASAQPQKPQLSSVCAANFDRDPSHPTQVNAESKACLDELARQLKASGNSRLILSGSSATEEKKAPQLAAQRAIQVKDYLVQKKGIDPARITMFATQNGAKSVSAYVTRLPANAVTASPEIGAPVNEALARSTPPPQPDQLQPEAHPSETDPYASAELEKAWKDSLKNGSIEYLVPPLMIAGTASGVRVKIHGFEDPSVHTILGANGGGTLKVSGSMRVELLAPDAPDEFAIEPQDSDLTQTVPIDSFAEWNWKVTPKLQASGQQLLIRVWLVPNGKDAAKLQPLLDQPYLVNVQVESLWGHLRALWQEDPIKVVKYFLPGGEGWSGIGAFTTGLIALLGSVGVIAWVRRRILGKKSQAAGAN